MFEIETCICLIKKINKSEFYRNKGGNVANSVWMIYFYFSLFLNFKKSPPLNFIQEKNKINFLKQDIIFQQKEKLESRSRRELVEGETISMVMD